MNEPILPPLPPETVDELLSAVLDGEFDAAAADLGNDLATARTAVAAHGERLEQLSRARDAVVDTPPLDEVTRRRLVSGAVIAATPAVHAPRRAVAVNGVVAAAAVVALLLGIGWLVVGIASWTASDQADDTAGGGGSGGDASTTALESASMLDLGDVSDADDLRRAVSERLAGDDSKVGYDLDESRNGKAPHDAGTATFTDAPPETESALEATTTAPDDTATRSGADPDTSSPVAGHPATCGDRVAADLQIIDPPLLSATAEHGGRPAGVSVFEVGGRVMVVVYALDDCTLLTSQLWTAG